MDVQNSFWWIGSSALQRNHCVLLHLAGNTVCSWYNEFSDVWTWAVLCWPREKSVTFIINLNDKKRFQKNTCVIFFRHNYRLNIFLVMILMWLGSVRKVYHYWSIIHMYIFLEAIIGQSLDFLKCDTASLCLLHKQTPTSTGWNPVRGDFVTRYLAHLSKVLHMALAYVDQAFHGYFHTFSEWRGQGMVKTTKPGLDLLQSCSNLASNWVKDIAIWKCNCSVGISLHT